MNTKLRDDDGRAILDAIGFPIPILLREAVDHGFQKYAHSRGLDPNGHAEYSDCSRANMLYDRIAAVARELVGAFGDERLTWKISSNKRATEIYLAPDFAFRIKRIKRNRHDLTTGVATSRQQKIKSTPRLIPVGQMLLPLPGAVQQMVYEHPLWVTVAFDLDEFEESVSRIYLGVERQKRFLWRERLPEAPADVIATLSPPLASKIMDLRSRRVA